MSETKMGSALLLGTNRADVETPGKEFAPDPCPVDAPFVATLRSETVK